MMRNAAGMGEALDLDDAARLSAEGSFVRLSHGYTHYDMRGPSGLRPVVLVHGFSVPYFIWDPTFNALTEAGIRTVRYDLYGRGFSDRPNIKYDLALFVAQLGQLLDTLGDRNVDLIGLSMGGPITAAFAAAFPEKVRKVVLIDPSGGQPVSLGGLYKLAALPGIGDVLFGVLGTEYLLNTLAGDFFDQELVETFRERYQVQMKYRGFKRALLSTVRNKMLGSFTAVYAALGRIGMPVLLIWGRRDMTVPFGQSQTLLRLMPRAEFFPVPDCGHIPHYERPELVNPRLIEFLK